MFQRMSAGKHSSRGCGWLPAGLLSTPIAPPCLGLFVHKAGTIIPSLGQPRGLILLAAELSGVCQGGWLGFGTRAVCRGSASSFLHCVWHRGQIQCCFCQWFYQSSEHPTTTWVTPRAWATICAICLQGLALWDGAWRGSMEGATRARVHRGAVLWQGSGCMQAGPAPIPFCIVFLKSGAEGMPGRGAQGSFQDMVLGCRILQ